MARVTTDTPASAKTSKSDHDEKVATHDLFNSKEYRLRNPVEQTTELPDGFNNFPRDEAKSKTTSSTGSKTDVLSRTPDNLSAESLDILPGESADMDKHHYERKLEQKSDISGEIKVLKEIKDIRDELNILHRILTEQRSVTDKLFSPSNRLKMNPDVQEYYLEQSGLERRIQDVEKMDKDAERTYTHVSISLMWMGGQKVGVCEIVGSLPEPQRRIVFNFHCLWTILSPKIMAQTSLPQLKRNVTLLILLHNRSTISSTSSKNKRISTKLLREHSKAR